MSKKKKHEGSHAKSDINVTPLIDIVLVLLIVFIVMVPSLARAQTVVVPSIQQAPPNAAPPPIPPLVVSIDQDGKMFLQQDECKDYNDLSEKLVDGIKRLPINERKMFLKVDEDIPYQTAVAVLDRIKPAGKRAKDEQEKDPQMAGQTIADLKVVMSLKKRG